MTINEAVFAGSSTRESQKPSLRLPEFAFIGRSNVGKSSLINMLCGNSKLAKTSSTPGKTKLINHFRINGKWYLVDLPGYGFAKISKTAREELRKMINDYITRSREMVVLFVLLDSRHDITRIDREFIASLGEMGVPFVEDLEFTRAIFTKGDKLGPNALKAQIEKNRQILMEEWEELPPVFSSSSETGEGRDEILDYIEQYI